MKVDAMLQAIQYDYLSDNIIHVDLLRIDIKKPVFINVPIKLSGEAIGVRLEDGSIDFVTREIKIKCLVTQIPNKYEINISDLHVGHSIKAADLDVEDGVELISDLNTVICAVTSKAKEEVVEAEVEEVVSEGAEAEAAAAETEDGKPAEDKKKDESEKDKSK
jgi:large subunit ribosomal protein L25